MPWRQVFVLVVQTTIVNIIDLYLLAQATIKNNRILFILVFKDVTALVDHSLKGAGQLDTDTYYVLAEQALSFRVVKVSL